MKITLHKKCYYQLCNAPTLWISPKFPQKVIKNTGKFSSPFYFTEYHRHSVKVTQPHHCLTWELWSCAASMPSSTEAMSRDIGVPLWSTVPTEQGLRCKVGGSLRPMTASGSSSLRFLPWRRHGCNGTARTRTSHGNLCDESVQHYHVYDTAIYWTTSAVQIWQ